MVMSVTSPSSGLLHHRKVGTFFFRNPCLCLFHFARTFGGHSSCPFSIHPPKVAGSILESGDIIAVLTLDDTTQVRRPSSFTESLPGAIETAAPPRYTLNTKGGGDQTSILSSNTV